MMTILFRILFFLFIILQTQGEIAIFKVPLLVPQAPVAGAQGLLSILKRVFEAPVVYRNIE